MSKLFYNQFLFIYILLFHFASNQDKFYFELNDNQFEFEL